MKVLKYILVGKVLILTFIINYFSSCTYDNEEDLLKDFQCDTVGIVYNDLTYIFSDNCADCHNETLFYRDIKMNTIENVRISINTDRVLPAIKHEGQYKMPFERPKLSDCDIEKIEAWINAGMPEN
ncbi:hypothetical protein ACFLSE_01110 [Bacteroidota bacterium]